MASSTVTTLKRQVLLDQHEQPPSKRARTDDTMADANGAKPDITKILADARARAAAAAARLTGSTSTNGTASPAAAAAPTTTSPASAINPSTQDKIAQFKARIAAAQARTQTATPAARPTASIPPPISSTHFDDGLRARGGLDVGLHPALMADASTDMRTTAARGSMAPKFATTMANRQTQSSGSSHTGKRKRQLDLSGPSLEETRNNPYFDPALGPKTALARGRTSRQLFFNQKGKYIQQAAALRRQAALEEMKKRIAESSRRAGVTEELETDKAFLVPAPPEIEWWDEGIVAGPNYNDIDTPGGLKIETEDSLITAFVQHPVPIEPPQEKTMPAPKAMFLTPKEQAKLRRQRRMADLKEQQAKVRLGLEPAPPPKVKKSNLVRVLGEEAVKDPTAVEARVNREIAERLDKHLQANEDAKLTKDQRHEKLEQQQAGDAARGIFMTVYKIDSLANGRHRFKIAKNAEQNALTGVCIIHPKFSLVVVEGGAHSIRFYKKLMLQRIDWTENSGPNAVREGNREALAAWMQAEDDSGQLKDLSLNKCTLVWEGEEKARTFHRWGSRVCETDKDARDALARAKVENFWTLARNTTGA